MGFVGSGSWPAVSMAGGVVPEKQPGQRNLRRGRPALPGGFRGGRKPKGTAGDHRGPNQGEVGKRDGDSTLFGAIRSSSSSHAAAPTRRERRRPLSPMWSALPGDERDVEPASERSSEPTQ